jgi:hypothetical protein
MILPSEIENRQEEMAQSAENVGKFLVQRWTSGVFYLSRFYFLSLLSFRPWAIEQVMKFKQLSDR